MKYKQNFIVYINIFICIFVFFLLIYFQKDICCIRHDFFLPYNNNIGRWLYGRIPANLLSFLTINFIPRLLGIHSNDFMSIANSFIKSIPLFLLGIIAVKCFFISAEEKINIFKRFESAIIIILSFLLIFYGNIDHPVYMFYTRETIVFYEYSFGVIFYFLFLFFILNFILHKNISFPFNKYTKSLIILVSFLCGFWNEHINIAVFWGIVILFLLLRDKIFYELKVKNKELMYLIIPFFIGLFMFYICSDYVLSGFNEIAGHKYNIENFTILKTYFNKFNNGYFNYIFCYDRYTYLFIVISAILVFFTKTKYSNTILIFCFSVLFGHLLTNYIYIFSFDAIYSRVPLVTFHSLILAFILIILLGELYNSNKSKIIKIAVIVFLICITCNYCRIISNNYSEIINKNSYIKQSLYRLDEINLVYNILGESAILPVSIFYDNIYKSTNIFIFQDFIENYSQENYKKFLYNRYFNYYYTGYCEYFNKQYKKNLIGFYITDDITAYKELKKRLDIINIFINRTDDAKLKFNNLNKYKNIELTPQNIAKVKITKENENIILKIKAFFEYKKNNYDSAISLYNEYLNKYDEDYDVLINLAQIYMKQKKIKKAMQIYQKLHNKDRYNVGFLSELISINYETDKNYKEIKSMENEIYDQINKLYIYKFEYKKNFIIE